MNTKYLWTKFNLVLLLIMLPAILSAETDIDTHYQFDNNYSHKLFSGRLLYAIDTKLQQGTNADFHKVYLFFENYPAPEIIAGLHEKGCWLDLEHYTPAHNDHKYGFLFARIPIEALNAIVAMPSIMKIADAEAVLYPQNNIASAITYADSVAAISYTGQGVTIGILDSGLDISYKGTELPGSIAAFDYSAYPDSIDFNVYNRVTGHGTAVTASALGRGIYSIKNDINGGGKYDGTAPNADLVFLKIAGDKSSTTQDGVLRAAAIDAVEYYGSDILSISYGEYGVYHDGTSALEATIDWLVDTYNVPVFCSAGNGGQDRYHFYSAVQAGDTSSYIKVNGYEKSTPLDFNLVWSNADSNELELLYYDNDQKLYDNVYHYETTTSERKTSSNITLASSGLTSKNNNFYLRVVNKGARATFFHIYKYNKGEIYFAEPSYSHLTLKPSNADKAFSVGSYNSRNEWKSYLNTTESHPERVIGTLCDFSANGPRLDGKIKPDIVAPGSFIISLRDRNMVIDTTISWISGNGSTGGNPYYSINSGTSFSAPMVAGIAAQIRERFEYLNVDTLYSALRNSASRDEFTGAIANSRYGYGKIDALSIMKSPSLPFSITTLPLEKNMYCTEDSIKIAIAFHAVFEAGNQFIVELSNNSGTFSSPYVLLQRKGTSADTFACRLPQYLLASDKYRVRVRSTNPKIIGSTNGSAIAISALPVVDVTGLFEVCQDEAYQYSLPVDPSSNYHWEIENGKIIDSNANNITVLWSKSATAGKVYVMGEKKISKCSDELTFDVKIKKKPGIFLMGDSLICKNQSYKYVTALKPNESARWYVSNATITKKSDAAIEVLFDDYDNGAVELVVDNDTCETRKKIKAYNLQGEASKVYGEKKPALKRVYNYHIDTLYNGVHTYWEVRGGIIVDSALNFVAIRWTGINDTKIILQPITKECDIYVEHIIKVQEEYSFQMEGKDTVCYDAVEYYKVSPFDTLAEYSFRVDNGTIAENFGDSAIAVHWNKAGSGYIEVIKEIESIGYIDTLYKSIITIAKYGASITNIADKTGFCMNDAPYTLIEGSPKGGYYYGEGVVDGVFYPERAGDARSVNIYYVYPADAICADTVSVQLQLWYVPAKPELLDYEDYLIAHADETIFNWYLNDTTFIETGNGKYTPEISGWYSVTCINANGCESDFSNRIYKEVKVDAVEDITSNWKIYPNPAKNILNIEPAVNQVNSNANSQVYGIAIYDLKAVVYYEKNNCHGNSMIDISNMSAGTYFVKIQVADACYIRKVIIEL